MSKRPHGGRFTPKRRSPSHQHSQMTSLMHSLYLWKQLHGQKLRRYSDGGPCDLNRSRKRAKAKAQRQARKAQRL